MIARRGREKAAGSSVARRGPSPHIPCAPRGMRGTRADLNAYALINANSQGRRHQSRHRSRCQDHRYTWDPSLYSTSAHTRTGSRGRCHRSNCRNRCRCCPRSCSPDSEMFRSHSRNCRDLHQRRRIHRHIVHRSRWRSLHHLRHHRRRRRRNSIRQPVDRYRRSSGWYTGRHHSSHRSSRSLRSRNDS